MKKIPTLFEKDDPDGLVVDRVNPKCRWVLDGEGTPCGKLDGTACAVIGGKLHKRYDNSRSDGKDRRCQKSTPALDWIHCGCTTERGRYIYWIPIRDYDYYHHIAWAWAQGKLPEGTYELIGPKIQSNPHKFETPELVKHDLHLLRLDLPLRTFEIIKNFLHEIDYEGIVFHHPDGRMAKITKAKMGIPWPSNDSQIRTQNNTQDIPCT